MSCPKCQKRQWNLDENTLTCKNGHRIPVGKKLWRPDPVKLIAAVAPASFVLGLLAGRVI